MNTQEAELVGAVTHYYPKVSVAVVKLASSLKVGDMIKVMAKEGEFTQRVSSMQVNHQAVEAGKAGEEVAVQLEQKAREGDKLYRAE